MENNISTKEVHISTIRQGDTIIHNGKISTVCRKDIHYDTFMGTTIFGDSYRLGYKKITLIHFKCANNKG